MYCCIYIYIVYIYIYIYISYIYKYRLVKEKSYFKIFWLLPSSVNTFAILFHIYKFL